MVLGARSSKGVSGRHENLDSRPLQFIGDPVDHRRNSDMHLVGDIKGIDAAGVGAAGDAEEVSEAGADFSNFPGRSSISNNSLDRVA